MQLTVWLVIHYSIQVHGAMLPLGNQFLDDIDGDVGEDGIFKADYVKQVKDAAESVFLNMRTACKVTESVNIRACYLNKSSITKAQLVEWLETTVCLLNSYTVPLLDFAVEHQSELEELKSEKIADQRKIIDLQEQLIVEKDNKLQSVQKTVESEMKSYSAVLQKSCTEALAPRKIAAAVKSVEEKVDRSTNVIVFGVPEENNESVDSKVMDLLDRLEEKPKVTECRRIGKSKPATTRPISFRVQSSCTVALILQKARQLKDIDGYKSIYLCPDRTLEERNTRKKLVDKLKEKRASDQNNRYFIRRGEILCAEK